MIKALVKIGPQPVNRMLLSRLPEPSERVIVKANGRDVPARVAVCDEVRETSGGAVYFLTLQ